MIAANYRYVRQWLYAWYGKVDQLDTSLKKIHLSLTESHNYPVMDIHPHSLSVIKKTYIECVPTFIWNIFIKYC